jgi:hypothetical protein
MGLLWQFGWPMTRGNNIRDMCDTGHKCDTHKMCHTVTQWETRTQKGQKIQNLDNLSIGKWKSCDTLWHCDTSVNPKVFKFIGPFKDGRRHGRDTSCFYWTNSHIISITVLENVPSDAGLQKKTNFSTLIVGLDRTGDRNRATCKAGSGSNG